MSNKPPDKIAENGRDPKTGRYLPGHPGGPGRPRGIDFRRLVTEKAEATGLPLESALWSVFMALLKQAREGDVRAARLILDRICDVDLATLQAQAGVAVTVVTNVPDEDGE
jgi:hypothetical protein